MKKLTILCIIIGLFFSAASQNAVKSWNKISDTSAIFNGTLTDNDYFGCSVANIGDLNNDGTVDLAVGAPYDDDGGSNRGAIWILFLDTFCRAVDSTKISDLAGGFTGTLSDDDGFGIEVTNIGDLDNDGVTDIAVGAPGANSGEGEVWILFLNTDGTVKSHYQMNESTESLNYTFLSGLSDGFGRALAGIGDLDGDGNEDMAAGFYKDNLYGAGGGVLLIMFLNSDGSVKADTLIADSVNGLPKNTLKVNDEFGTSVTNLGDLDNDGVTDIVVGATHDDDGGNHNGAVYVLFMNTDGTVKSFQKISETAGGFDGTLMGSYFGKSIAAVGDANADGTEDIIVCEYYRDDKYGTWATGAAWVLLLNTDGTVKTDGTIIICSDTNGFDNQLDSYDLLGKSAAGIGDINNDGYADFVVSAYCDDDGGSNRGAIYIMNLDPNGLPVTLVSFSATNAGRKNLLEWETASEINNDKFIIERSVGGQDFKNIGFVYGQGNSNVLMHYSFTDTNPLQGINYYRLKQVDFDGKYTYSQIISATSNPAGSANLELISISGNNQLSLHLMNYSDEEKLIISLTSPEGKQCINQEKLIISGDARVNLYLNNTPAGIYILVIRTENNTDRIQKQIFIH